MDFIKTYIIPILDITIVATLIFLLYRLISGTRTIQVLRGLSIIGLAYFVGRFLELDTFLWLFEKGLEVAAIALVVIFQNEIRRIVMKLGENAPLISGFMGKRERELIEILSPAVHSLSENKTGALIVITRNTALGVIIERGIKLDSIITRELIESVFLPKNPLHDGALIIVDDRIAAAGCLLPLTERTDLSKIFGTRHRAAIGITEETDAVVVVVSEENGKLSIAHEGKLYYDLTQDKFESTLRRFLFESKPEGEDQVSKKITRFLSGVSDKSEAIISSLREKLSKTKEPQKNSTDLNTIATKDSTNDKKNMTKVSGDK